MGPRRGEHAPLPPTPHMRACFGSWRTMSSYSLESYGRMSICCDWTMVTSCVGGRAREAGAQSVQGGVGKRGMATCSAVVAVIVQQTGAGREQAGEGPGTWIRVRAIQERGRTGKSTHRFSLSYGSAPRVLWMNWGCSSSILLDCGTAHGLSGGVAGAAVRRGPRRDGGSSWEEGRGGAQAQEGTQGKHYL